MWSSATRFSFSFIEFCMYFTYLCISFFLSVCFCMWISGTSLQYFNAHTFDSLFLPPSLSIPLTISHHLSLPLCVCSYTCRDLWPGHLTIDIHGCTRIWFLLPIHISLFDKMFTALKANRPILIRSVWLTMIIWPNLRVCSSQNYEMPLMLTYPTIQTVQKDEKKPFRWVTFT